MSGQLGYRASGIITKKKATGDRVESVPYDVGVAGKAGKASPLLDFELALRAVENGFPEGDREADPGTQNLIVVRVVIHVAAEHIRVQPQFVRQNACVSARIRNSSRETADRQLHCGNAGVQISAAGELAKECSRRTGSGRFGHRSRED